MSTEEKQKEQAAAANRTQVMAAAAIVVGATLLSRVLGLVRQGVIVNYYGLNTIEANAFEIANRFPEAIYYIIAGGALGSAFIPTFSAYFTHDDEAGGWHLFSAIINLTTVVMIAAAGLTALLANQIIILFVPDLVNAEEGLLALTVTLMRIMLLSPIIFGASGIVMGALNARQHFLLPALAPVIYNMGIILGAVLLVPDVRGLAIGVVAGSLGHLLIQLPVLYFKKASYQPVLTLRHRGVQQVLKLMAPRVLGLSFGQLNHLAIQPLAQSMILGSIPALALAWRIMNVPLGILGQALGIAAFPTFATLAAQSALAEMRRILADTLRLIYFLGLPATIMLAVLRDPIILLFQRGQFDPDSVPLAASALLFYAVGLVALSVIDVASRAFYALSDTLTPVIAGAIQIVAMIVLSLWLSRVLFPQLGLLDLGGIALGISLANVVEMGALLWLLRRKMQGIDGHFLLDGVWRMTMAGSLMAGLMLSVRPLLPILAPLWELVIMVTLGGVFYLLLCILFKVREVHHIWGLSRRLLRRKL